MVFSLQILICQPHGNKFVFSLLNLRVFSLLNLKVFIEHISFVMHSLRYISGTTSDCEQCKGDTLGNLCGGSAKNTVLNVSSVDLMEGTEQMDDGMHQSHY